MKGPFKTGSSVMVYAVTNGTKESTPLAQTSVTDDSGSYSADLGSYTGPIIVEVSGTYLDEATGATVTVPSTAPLRAALPNASGNITLPVTALTELAVKNAGGNLTATTITTANALITTIFKVDVTAITPVVPTAAALGTATQSQKDYTLALAAVSQMASSSTGANNSDKLATALTTISQGISSSGMSATVATSFQNSLVTFVQGNSNNQTGVTDISTSGLVSVGTQSYSYNLALQGITTAQSVKGAQFDLALPVDVLSASIKLSSGAPTGTYLDTGFSQTSATIGVMNTQGMSNGVFATITFYMATGKTVPPLTAFGISNFKAVDKDGAAVSGVAAMVQ
jgi:hypothetical protein